MKKKNNNQNIVYEVFSARASTSLYFVVVVLVSCYFE